MALLAILTTIGFLAGFIDSVAGGGGLISIPALMACGLPAHLALGTNKFQAMIGTLSALTNYSRRSKVVWKVAVVGIPFSLAGSIGGARLALYINEIVLAKIIIAGLPLAASIVIPSRRLVRISEKSHISRYQLLIATPLACAVMGLYDGFFGPGTGTLLIIALALFLRIPMVNASATAKTFNVASNIGSLVVFITSENINYTIGTAMAIANVGGAIAGSHLAMKHGQGLIKKLLAISLAMLFIHLVWKYILQS